MAQANLRSITLDDEPQRRRLHATWSRSAKNLIVTVGTPDFRSTEQVELSRQQVESLAAFLAEPPSP
jgi:hypothetical protein